MPRPDGAQTDAAGTDSAEPGLAIVAGNPTPSELAAVTAVIAALLAQIEDDALQGSVPRVSAWQRSQRPIRRPMRPGPGEWRSFRG